MGLLRKNLRLCKVDVNENTIPDRGIGTGDADSETGMTAGEAGGLLPDHHPMGDFFVCDFFDALPKDALAAMEHPVFSLSTCPDRRILSYLHNGVEITVTPSVRGLATIHDKDILIYCISQLVASLNVRHVPARKLTLKAHDLLVPPIAKPPGMATSASRAPASPPISRPTSAR